MYIHVVCIAHSGLMCVCMQGYRSLMGINVAQSCEAALSYYHKAAQKGVIAKLY